MRIGSVSGMGSAYSVSPYYTISSIHGNPKSLDAVDGISQQSESAKPLAIVKPVSEDEEQKIRQKQTMTAVNDYESVMAQMMNGRNPENVVSSVAETAENSNPFTVDGMLQTDNTELNADNVEDMQQMDTQNLNDVSVDDLLQTDYQEQNDVSADVTQIMENGAEAAGQSIELPDASEENMADTFTKNNRFAMADAEVLANNNQGNINGMSQAFSYQMQRAIDAYNMAAGF